MKNQRLLLAVVVVLVAIMGCGSSKTERSGDLVVVEQTDTVRGNNENNQYEWAAFTVDVPVNGPQALVDSVMAFINEQLYEACESNAHFYEKCVTFSKEEMFSDDSEQLFGHYMEKYKPLIQDSLWRTFGQIMKLEAQTDKYVTYGLELFFCGAGCSSEKYYYTFDKSDGHQIKEIISHDNLVRFFEDYPEYSTLEADPWAGASGWKFFPENEFVNYNYGLLDDHFSLVICGYGNHFFLLDFPYGQIFSYLSPEAQNMVEQTDEEETMLPAYMPERSEDSEVWMEVDTLNRALLGYIRAAGGPHVSTLMNYEPELEIYPKRVHSIDVSDGPTAFLFIYSRGHLSYCDEAMMCIINDDNYLQPATLFSLEGEKDSVVSCMWYDQVLEATEGFPFEEVDENRFGIHYDPFTKRLYIPIMDHDKWETYESCPRYSGRFDVLYFDGKKFVPAGTDGAWWLNPDLRNYKRTVSNRKVADGIEQIDLMPDGTYRRSVWKGAKTLDDLRKKPDEVKLNTQLEH